MTNAIQVLLQMQSVFLQLESTLIVDRTVFIFRYFLIYVVGSSDPCSQGLPTNFSVWQLLRLLHLNALITYCCVLY
jgi:hypothetical protein